MLSSITMDNQGLTTSASHKFAVEFAGPRSPHTHGWGWRSPGPCPALLIAEKCWLGSGAEGVLKGRSPQHTLPLSALHPLGTLLHWDSHYGKLFPTQEISVKDSYHLQASSWWVSWFCGIFLSLYFVFQKKNSSTAHHCFSLLFNYATLLFLLDVYHQSFWSPYFLLLLLSVLSLIFKSHIFTFDHLYFFSSLHFSHPVFF